MQKYSFKVGGVLLSKRPWSLKTDDGTTLTGFSYAFFDPVKREVHMFSITDGQDRLQIPDSRLVNIDADLVLDLVLKTNPNGKTKLSCEKFDDL